MHLEGLCDAPRLGMHLYMLVQTCCGSFMVFFAVKTQFIEKHNNPGIYHAYVWYLLRLVMYHGYL